jgi:hypothetical protein
VSSVLTFLLMLGAIALGLWGGSNLTQATLGVGLVCLGCLTGIIARILQADGHHAKLEKLLKSAMSKSAMPPTTPKP